jgi:ribosomal protein S18 acetylase RimI-like enzyme
MIKADQSHKGLVVDIISKSFDNNKGVNWVIKQGAKRKERIIALAEYSFDFCQMFGSAYISDDHKACALILYPDRKKINIKTIYLEIKFAFKAVGLGRVFKIIKREAKINSFHPKGRFAYIWFIGVDPEYQGKGYGSKLLTQVINACSSNKLPICLETSTIQNALWYKKFGFKLYKILKDFGYTMYMFQRSC